MTSAKYLGVTIQDDLKWNSHVTNITKKTNNALAFLRRNIRIKSTDLKTNAYKALVCPLVEYASTVWDPHTNNLINNIEMVPGEGALTYNGSIGMCGPYDPFSRLVRRSKAYLFH